MLSEDATFAHELKKKSSEDAGNQEVISRLISEHERQKKALEDERERAASANRKLLDLAADKILNLEARIMERDQEILALREEKRAHMQGCEASCAQIRARALEQSRQPGPPLSTAMQQPSGTDTLSVSDVVQKVAALNEEIFQAGALLAETLFYEPALESVEENTLRRQEIIAKDTAYKILGTALTDLLARESMKPQEGPVNQLLAQIVLLIALTRWCSSICRGWIPDDKETNAFLEELYDDIRRAEDQAVAGRWRSLTRAHLSISTAEWTKDAMRVITCIMGLAGWNTQMPDDLTQFERRLESIVKALCEARKATGEDVTSADLEVFVVYRGDDYHPGLMEDSYGDDCVGALTSDGEKEKVVGPSGLGLRKVNIVETATGLERRLEYLSFPKVVLEKTVKEAIEPPPPPKPRKNKDKGVYGGGGLMGMLGLS